MTQDGKVPFTQEEEDAQDAYEAAEISTHAPMRNWKRDMANFGMSRSMENHIKEVHGGVAGNAFDQAIYDAKVARRAQRP